MFFTKLAKDEIASSFESEITKFEEQSKNIGDVTADISRYLEKAAEILLSCGLTEDAETIKKIAEDVATKGLTSEKMTANLKGRGIVMNLPTDKATDLPKEMKGKDHGWKADDGAIEEDEEEIGKD
jgi:hypothetical protein